MPPAPLGLDTLLYLAVLYWPGTILLLLTLAVLGLPWHRTIPGQLALATGVGGSLALGILLIDLSR